MDDIVPSAMARQATGLLLYRAHRRARSMVNRALKPLGIDVRHLGVLAVLADTGPITQRALIDILDVDKSSMVYLIDALERLNMVERRRPDHDRRAFCVHLTDHGRRSLDAASQVMTETMDEVLGALDPDQVTTLNRLLHRVIAGGDP